MTHDDFLKAVEADPSLPGPKLVYADWLEEDGNDALAFAYRWAAKRGKWPNGLTHGAIVHYKHAQYTHAWATFNSVGSQEHYVLPDIVYNLCPHAHWWSGREYRSAADAMRGLAQALERLRCLLEV